MNGTNAPPFSEPQPEEKESVNHAQSIGPTFIVALSALRSGQNAQFGATISICLCATLCSFHAVSRAGISICPCSRLKVHAAVQPVGRCPTRFTIAISCLREIWVIPTICWGGPLFQEFLCDILRNLNPEQGLCNGTRCRIIEMRPHVLQVRIITGPTAGAVAFIPHMKLQPSDSKLPFTLELHQFPVRLCFAMTVNKSQGQISFILRLFDDFNTGQSLKKVGLDLRVPAFSHSQLYVALSN